MNLLPDHWQFFTHIRIIVAMVLGLSMSRIINGLARFIQHPKHYRIYSIHLGWSFFLILSLIYFWWFEFGLSAIEDWTFELYFFIIFYAVLFAMISSILFPDSMEEYAGYEHYFRSRRPWFYGLLALMFLVDVLDTWIKGPVHFNSLGIEYPIRQAGFFICSVIAMFVSNKRYQQIFVVVALVYQTIWILRVFRL